MLTVQQPLTKTQAQRLRNYLNASAATGAALSATPTVQELAEHPSVTAALLDALDVAPAMLIASNATLEQLTAIGYGSSHLVRTPALAVQLVGKFGKAPTAAAVLRTPQDAVVLSTNVITTRTLGVSTRMLLDACCGDQASGVCIIHNLLQQHRARPSQSDAAAHPSAVVPTAAANLELLKRKLEVGPLHGVGCETLARLGLDGRALYTHFQLPIDALCETLGVTPDKLRVLNVFQQSA